MKTLFVFLTPFKPEHAVLKPVFGYQLSTVTDGNTDGLAFNRLSAVETTFLANSIQEEVRLTSLDFVSIMLHLIDRSETSGKNGYI